MASKANGGAARNQWRMIGWGTAAALLVAPFVAMQFTREVNWTGSDFVVFGLMLLAVGIPLELAARYSGNRTYLAAAALALLGAFLVTWANLAVGIVGSDDNPANQLFFVALLIGLVGAVLARFRARGMSFAMLASALGLEAAFLLAVTHPTDEPQVSHLTELAGTSLFAALFLLSAWLFRRAARS
ncbi:MAG TPA: hypothetical protein VF750_01200 [Sphingomicrobium sp.]